MNGGLRTGQHDEGNGLERSSPSPFDDRRLADGSLYISQAHDLPLNAWRTFRKTAVTKAQPVTGPLVVKTREGEYTLPPEWRGWIALDSGGYPYPIVEDEFAAMYEEIAG